MTVDAYQVKFPRGGFRIRSAHLRYYAATATTGRELHNTVFFLRGFTMKIALTTRIPRTHNGATGFFQDL